jgi:hypothetical protein
VRSYAADSKDFPHESTGDQLFGESQFEAYRALGENIIATIDGDKSRTYDDIRSFINAAAARLAKPGTPAEPQCPERVRPSGRSR